MTGLGKRPELCWIDKRLLSIEPSYQRTLSAHRSQSLIGKLAAGFCWAHCAPLVVAPKGKGWVIIDGQHRHQAALRHDGIKDLPCYVVDARDLKDQAKAFVAHNRDRIALTTLALFHADVAAGEAAAASVIKACAAAGVTVPRTPLTLQTMAPDQCAATGVMSRICALEGPKRLTEVLTLIREAHPNAQGQLRGRSIGAVAAILQHGWLSRADLVKALQRKDGQLLENDARAVSAANQWTLNEAFVAVLMAQAGKNAMAAVEALRAEDKERARAHIRAVSEAQRPKREAAKAERAAKREAEKAERAAKREAEAAEHRRKAAETKKPRRAKPFRFDRSKPSGATAPRPKEVRGDVKVRRFEMGASGLGADDFLKRCGYEVSKRPQGYDVKKTGAPGKPKRLNHAQLIELLNTERKKRGLQPATVGDAA